MTHADKGRAALAAAAALFGRSGDPFAPSWDGMPEAERAFWLNASRLPGHYAGRTWVNVPQEARARLKNNLYRAAERARVLLKPCFDVRAAE